MDTPISDAKYFTFTTNDPGVFEMAVTIPAENIAAAAKFAYDVYGDSVKSVSVATAAERVEEIARREAQIRKMFA